MKGILKRLLLFGGLVSWIFCSCSKNQSPASPFNVPPQPPSNFIASWGSTGSGNGQISNPQGIAVNSAGTTLYVADEYNNRVEAFNASGAYLTQWGSFGNGNGQFFFGPEEVAVNSAGTTLYVTDNYDSRVEAFSASGSYLTQWGSLGAGNGQFNYGPQGLAMNSAGTTLYATDDENSRVETFSGSGAYLSQWATDENVYYPSGIAVNSAGTTLYVTDPEYDIVEVYNGAGVSLTQWGVPGTVGAGNGQFNRPIGIALSPDNSKIYIVDSGNNRVEVFDASGKYLSQFGIFGLTAGFFNVPTFIAVDGAGYLYVSDTGNNRVEKFAP
jgi:DNA-binding beta-propeller fold protein YncE